MYRSLDDSFEIVWWHDDGFTDNFFLLCQSVT